MCYEGLGVECLKFTACRNGDHPILSRDIHYLDVLEGAGLSPSLSKILRIETTEGLFRSKKNQRWTGRGFDRGQAANRLVKESVVQDSALRINRADKTITAAVNKDDRMWVSVL